MGLRAQAHGAPWSAGEIAVQKGRWACVHGAGIIVGTWPRAVHTDGIGWRTRGRLHQEVYIRACSEG